MSSLLETQLYKATGRTFEELGFMLPSSELEEGQRTARAEAAVEIGFQGPFAGRLVLSVSGGILPAIVANMLGDDDSNGEGSQNDALGELANVICGNVLPGIAGNKVTFDLAPPRLIDPATVRKQERLSCEVHVGIEQGRADVYLYLEGGPLSAQKEQAA
jgi:CheY-specific phosphatase CheX